MKNILILLLTICGLAAQAQAPQKFKSFNASDFKAKEKRVEPTFEGVVTITDTKAYGYTGEYEIKGFQVASTRIFKEDEKRKKIINNEERTAISLEKVKGEKLAIKTLKIEPRQTVGEVKISVTTATKKIGDYQCTKVMANDNFTEIEAWVATDLNIYLGDLFAIESGLEMLNQITSKTGVEGTILEMIRTDIATDTTSKMIVSVDAKKIKDKVFKIPRGYKLVEKMRKSNTSRSLPSATSFKGVTNRAYEIQKKVREGKMETPAEETAPAKAAPAATPKKE